jgi:hypothetical protein
MMKYEYEIRHVEHKKFVYGRYASDIIRRTITFRISGSAISQAGGWWHPTSRRIQILWQGE